MYSLRNRTVPSKPVANRTRGSAIVAPVVATKRRGDESVPDAKRVDYKVSHDPIGDVVQPLARQLRSLELYVSTMDRSSQWTVLLNEAHTIGGDGKPLCVVDLGAALRSIIGSVAPDDMCLLFNNRVLDDENRSLESYGIVDKSSVVLVFKKLPTHKDRAPRVASMAAAAAAVSSSSHGAPREDAIKCDVPYPHVHARAPSGLIYTVSIVADELATKVLHVRRQFAGQMGVSAPTVALFFGDAGVYDNERAISDYGITSGSMLELRIVPLPPSLSLSPAASLPPPQQQNAPVFPPSYVSQLASNPLPPSSIRDAVARRRGGGYSLPLQRLPPTTPVTRNVVESKEQAQLRDELKQTLSEGLVRSVPPPLRHVFVRRIDVVAESVDIVVDAATTVSELSQKFADRTGLPATQQILLINTELNPLRTLGDYNVRDGETIHVVKEITGMVRDVRHVFVKTLVGKIVYLRCDPFDFVVDVKRRLFHIEGIPEDEQRFIFGGKQLEDHCTLVHYDVPQYSLIHLVLRLRGGMFHETSGRSDNAVLQNVRVAFLDHTISIGVSVDTDTLSTLVAKSTTQFRSLFPTDEALLKKLAAVKCVLVGTSVFNIVSKGSTVLRKLGIADVDVVQLMYSFDFSGASRGAQMAIAALATNNAPLSVLQNFEQAAANALHKSAVAATKSE